MAKGKIDPLGAVLKRVLSSLKKKGRYTEEDIALFWEKAAGSKAAGHTKPAAFKGGRLVVNVDGSSWLYELTLKKRDILKKFNDQLKGKKIKEIRFRIGETTKREKRDEGEERKG